MKGNIRKFKVLGILSLPLAALAVVAVLLGMSLGQGSNKAAADFPHTDVDFSAGIGAECDSSGVPTAKCSVALGTNFKVTVKLNNDGTPDIAVAGYDAKLLYSAGLTLVADKQPPSGPMSPLVQQGSPNNWPDCGFPASALGTIGTASVGCGLGIGGVAAPYTGPLFQINFTCVGEDPPATQTITLVHGAGNTSIADDVLDAHGETGSEVLQVNCVPATNTPTPTPTSTPPPIPRVFKKPVLSNVFLTAQGAKIPPATCNASTNVATLTEQINQAPVTVNAKNELQDLAAFEFAVRFDPKLVCVNLIPSQQWQDLVALGQAVCIIRDKDSSTLEGIAEIGCITVGKGIDSDGLTLATIEVRPQPELYSQIRPNQDNGIVAQILNQNCELADEQGHAIPIFSCEDADITFRYLEGDVGGPGTKLAGSSQGPNCAVDVFDAQNVAFRWGVRVGSLLYNSFMDLEPSGQVKGDGDIDIKDIQFVFGRFLSTCANPWPAQLPANPKGVKP